MCKAPLGDVESCETEEVGTWERGGSGARRGVLRDDAARRNMNSEASGVGEET